jgi:hypothetical protein
MHIDLLDAAVGTFNDELLREISVLPTGGAGLGKALRIAHPTNEGDFESWIREWSAPPIVPPPPPRRLWHSGNW